MRRHLSTARRAPRQLAAYPDLLLRDQAEFKQEFRTQIEQLPTFIYVLLGLAVVIAILGIVNTLWLSVIEHTREVGLMRAVGTTRNQLSRKVVLESVVISVFGALRGLGLGTVACDVATAQGCDELVAAVKEHFTGCDILFNNAGAGSNETILEAPDDKWQAYWDLHVMAAVRLARGLVPGMARRGGGAILHNASICAVQPLGYEPIYNVTKAALMMFSKTLSTEVVASDIRVNCLNPGLILTPDWISTAKKLTADSGGDWQGHLDSVAAEHAANGRFARPEEVADFVVFLCSERASYSVGSTYFIDGGMLKTV